MLGLKPSRQLTTAEIRRAYKKLVPLAHPDKSASKGASVQSATASWFRGVQEAYEVLGDPSRRRQYDDEMNLKSDGANKVAFNCGQRVRIRNLKKKPAYNGRAGEVSADQPTSGRYRVSLLFQGAVINLDVKEENLIKID